MDKIETKVEKLTAHNYTNWSIVLTSLLKAKGLYKFCKEETQLDTEATMMKSEEAKALMYMAMDSNQIAATGTCETAKDLWDKIRENHEGAQRDLMNNALATFLGFKFHKGETIIQYCGRFETALGRVLTTGQTVDNSTKIWVFRNSVPKDVASLITTWMMANPNGTCAELISQLKMNFHFEKTLGEEAPAVALYSGEKRDGSSKGNFNRNSVGRKAVRTNQGTNRSDSDSNNSNYCRYCKTSGHSWQNCPKKKNDDQRRKQFAEKNKTSPNGQTRQGSKNGPQGAYTAKGNAPVRCVNFSKNTWIIDSGATSHMTPHKEWLSDYNEYEIPKDIAMGTGKLAAAYGEGILKFRSGKFEGKLVSVLWVPQLQENLFSLGRTLSLGYDIKFDHSIKEVQFYYEGKLMLVGHNAEKNLFTIKLKPIAEQQAEPEKALLGASIDEWHKRFAHAGLGSIKDLIKSNAVTGLKVDNHKKARCEHCIMGKLCRCSHPPRSNPLANEEIAVLHIDTCGPIETPSLGGSKYFVLATEEYSGYRHIRFVTNKSDIVYAVKGIINLTELESKRPVKMIVTDNGTEYVNRALSSWLQEKGIIHDLSTPYTPEQNGRAERSNRTIIEGTRTLLSDSKLPRELWAEAANTVVYTLNRTLSTRDKTKTRFELYFNYKPDVKHLRPFGQPAIIRCEKRDSKWSKKGTPVVFVGYTNRQNTYRFYEPDTNAIVRSCDVAFLDNPVKKNHQTDNREEIVVSLDIPQSDNEIAASHLDNPSEHETPPQDISIQSISENPDGNVSTDATIENPMDSSVYHESIDLDGSINASVNTDDSSASSSFQDNRRSVSTRSMNQPLVQDPSIKSWFWQRGTGGANLALTLNDEPMNFKDAMSSPEWHRWKLAMDEELDALSKNHTWELVPREPGMKTIKNKWVYKIKLAPNGEIDRFKARLVAKGYSQRPNVDYKETFAPTASMNTIRILFAYANQQDMEILQFDVKTAFLYGDLDEVIHMEPPEGYPPKGDKVCRLIKSLYGLKQAPRQWNVKFDLFLKRFSLQQSQVDKCLYYNDNRSLLLIIYVDDGLVASSNNNLLKSLVNYLKQTFDLKTMQCEAYLGFQVTRNRVEKTLFLQQSHYIEKVLDRFNMLEAKPASTPEEVGALKLDTAEPLTEEYPFKQLVGSLLYLVTCTRPDIAHALSVASRTSKPTHTHWNRLKRILRYLKGTPQMGILFRWEKSPRLKGFCDADYANDPETRRSTTGFCIMYGSTPIAWRCQRQPVVSLSTTEAEYISGCELVKEILPLKHLMNEIGAIGEEPTTVLIDNQSTVKIAQDTGGQQRTKHIDVRQKWLSEQHSKGAIKVEHIPGDRQAADILTKPLHKTKFEMNRKLLVATLSIMTLASISNISAFTFTRVGPLMFKPTQLKSYNGDIDYKIDLHLVNPCESLFQYEGETKNQIRGLVDECHKSFREKTFMQMNNCRKQDVSGTVEKLRGAALQRTKSELSRPKRALPMIFLYGIMAYFGFTSFVQLERSENNIRRLTTLQERNAAALNATQKIIEEYKSSLQDLQQWSNDVNHAIANYTHLDGMINRLAALVDAYTKMFDKYSFVVRELDSSISKGRISNVLQTIANQTLWDEDETQHSTVFSCKNSDAGKIGTVISTHFTMPTTDPKVRVMKAVPLDFYNTTEISPGKFSICWMRYRGPKHVLVNTTNNCLTEIPDYAIEDPIRAFHCVTQDEELKVDGSLYTQDDCSEQPEPQKRRIQVKEANGLHRIYCYPWNITVNNDTHPCPDYPFELLSKDSYQISNLEHHGETVEKIIMTNEEIHINKGILSQLKTSFIIPTINFTSKLNETYKNYTRTLGLLPAKLELIEPGKLENLLKSPMKWFSNIKESIMGYIETIGIILSVVAAGILLIIVSPVLEVIFLCLKGIKVAIRTYLNLVRRLMNRMHGNTELPRYWETHHRKST